MALQARDEPRAVDSGALREALRRAGALLDVAIGASSVEVGAGAAS
jgi:hypothetical protein